MKLHLGIFLSFLLLNVPCSYSAKIKGVVVDKNTQLPLAFSTISYQGNLYLNGVVCDIYGRFEINGEGIREITVSSLGYQSKTIQFTKDKADENLIIKLEENPFSIPEITVTPANNPAIRIIRNALEKKKENNHEKYDRYYYECYFKTTADFKQSPVEGVNDSLPKDKKSPFDDMAVIISETVTQCSRNKNKTIEKIIATKTSGLETPIYAQASYSLFHKIIPFYNNSISIFGESNSKDKMLTDYLSPLADNCLSAYNYELNETYITQEEDTVFEITYFPKKKRKFNGLRGKIHISSNNFAIASIVAEPNEKTYIDFKFKQDYQYIAGKWFPKTLEEEIGFVAFVQEVDNRKTYPIYLVISNIDKVYLGVNQTNITDNNFPEKEFEQVDAHPSLKQPSRLEKVYIDEKSLLKTDSILQRARLDTLTLRELKTYHVVDSIGKEIKFDNILNSITNIDKAKISFNIVDVDFSKLYTYNRNEGNRLGLGLYTNDRLLRFLSAGGYFGYGFKDKKIKYGGELEFNLSKRYDIQLKYSYQNDLKEAGREMKNSKNLFESHFLRDFMSSRFDHCIQNKLEGNFQFIPSLRLNAALNLRDLTPTYAYNFKEMPVSKYHSDEIELSIRYAPGEQFMQLGTNKIPVSTGNPVINLSYKRGTNFIRAESIVYNKFETTLDYRLFNGRIGQSDIRVAGGYIDRNIPYSLLFTGEGSKDALFSFLIPHTFQTMRPYEFLSDKYLNLFYTHNFGGLLIRTKHFNPEFRISHNMSWGDLKNPAHYTNLDFKLKDKIYLESGLVIDNLIKANYLNLCNMGLGVGAFYRYGHYGFDHFKDNLSLKISFTISLR